MTATKTKHTRGPWRVDDNGDGTSCITAGRGCDVADTRSSVDEPANASLISAAPDLLAACKAILALPPKDRGSIEVELDLEAAIAKAEAE